MPTTTVQATNLDIRDIDAATDDITIHGDVGVVDQLDLTNSNPLVTAVVDANGDQITSFGGGTQYTESDTDASITGTAMMMEGAGNALVPAQGTTTDGLLVNLGSNNDVTVTGTVTANLSATDNAVLDDIAADTESIKTAVETIDNAISGSEMQVDVITMPTVTVTATNLDVQSGGADLATSTQAGAIQTAVELIDDTVKTLGTDTYTEATSKGLVMGAVRRDADTTLANTTNEFAPLQVDANGYLKVEIFDGGGSHTVDNAGTFAVQVDGNALTALQLIDDPVATDDTTTHSTGTTKVMGIGAVAAPTDTTLNANDIGMPAMTTTRELYGVIRDAAGNARGANVNASNQLTTIDANSASALTALQLIDDTVFTDDAAFTPGTSKVNAIGLQADETSTDSVDEGDIGAPRMTLDRKQISTIQPHTAGGLSVFNATSSDGATALTNSAQAIKASAGQVYGWYIYNPNSSAQFVQFYNTAAASVTVGTTNPLFMLTIPATSAANVEFTNGITFTNAGFSCAATSTAGGNGAPSTALDAVIFYK